jgi:hypothetical protein
MQFNWKQKKISFGASKPAKSLPNFCMAPFAHTYISPQSERRICCASREQASFQKQYIDASGPKDGAEYRPLTLDEHWNSEQMKSVRKRMLAGETLPECAVCNEEILTLSTYRNWFNQLFKNKIREAIEKTDADGRTDLPVISFDYRISNLCNFKCRMCGSLLSSQWESENRLSDVWNATTEPWMTPEMKAKMSRFQKDVTERELQTAADLGLIEELYWVGGEPVLWEIHWRIMQQLVREKKANRVFARYNTNLSLIEWRGCQLFTDLLPHFKDYLMCCSIDGTGKIGEFIRTGLNWEKWLENFKAGCAVDRRKMKLDLTLTLPGLFSLKEMFDLSQELDVGILTKITFAFDPSILMSPMCLPRPILNEIIDDALAYMQPKARSGQATLLATLADMKSRPTFAEQWPDSFRAGFASGQTNLKRLAALRGDGRDGKLSIEEIISQNGKVLDWWNHGE